MDVHRIINTKIWCDNWFEALSPNEKLIWIYLLCNPATNMLGIYELSVKRISFDTGLSLETVQKVLEGFERVRKALLIENFIVIPNWIKNQSMNPNMVKSAMKLYNNLPNYVITKLKENGSEGFESLSKGLVTLRKKEKEKEKEKESEIEKEIEEEKSGKKIPDTVKPKYFDQILKLFQTAYFESRGVEYHVTSRGKEDKAIATLTKIYKKERPDANTEQSLIELDQMFRQCLAIQDRWLYENMSLAIIASQFNKIRIHFKNTSNGKSAITDEDIDQLIAEQFGVVPKPN